MKRWLLILAVIATFFVGDRFGGYALEQLLYRSPQRFSKLYSGRFQADIVCIGNSRGMLTLNAPAIGQLTGKPAVNISHNGMSAQIARAVFADYLAHNPKPRTLVIEASLVTTATGRGLVAEYIPFWQHSPNLQALAKVYCPTGVAAAQLTWLYRYNSELYLRVLYYWLRGRNDQDSSMPGTVSPALLKEMGHLEPFELQIQPIELRALRAMVQEARDAGIEAKLVYAPYLPAYASRITNLDALIAKISKETGAEVIDLTRAIPETDHFADRVHVNRAGTLEMAKLLVERGVFN